MPFSNLFMDLEQYYQYINSGIAFPNKTLTTFLRLFILANMYMYTYAAK